MNSLKAVWWVLIIGCAVGFVPQDVQEPQKTAIDDAALLVGHWQGKMFGGMAQEIWSPPLGKTMMGMYKLVKDGKVVFYELMILVEEKDGLVLKLKHFNPDLTAWEDKKVTVDFPLIEKTKNALLFDGLGFRKADENTLNCTLRMKQKDGSSKNVEWVYKRVKVKS